MKKNRYHISEITKGNIKYLASECKFMLGIMIKKGERLTGEVYEQYENGKSKIQGYLKDGKKEGLQQSWYENDQLCCEVNYLKGEKNGVVRSWWKNGNLNSERMFKNGTKIGLERQWYKNGKLRLAMEYDEGGEIVKAGFWNMYGDKITKEEMFGGNGQYILFYHNNNFGDFIRMLWK